MNIFSGPEYIGPFYADFVYAVAIIALLGVCAFMQRNKQQKHETFFEGKKYYSDN